MFYQAVLGFCLPSKRLNECHGVPSRSRLLSSAARLPSSPSPLLLLHFPSPAVHLLLSRIWSRSYYLRFPPRLLDSNLFLFLFFGGEMFGGIWCHLISGRSDSRVLLKEMDFPELEKWVQSHGFRPGQALMLWKRLYGNNIWAQSFEELEGLNKDFRKMLCKFAEMKALSVKDILIASDGTRKILFSLEDGSVIETVVIPCSRGRNTVCVSSQVGCAMNCQFCFTGRMGLLKHLTTAEIVEQAVIAQRLFSSEIGPMSNVVFMGMGEPFHNIDNVLKAAAIMVDEQGLHFSPRKVTVSTSGLVPQLKRFLRESNCALAVSLNATTDEVRNWIMPINRKYNLSVLLDTLREELQYKHKFKVLFEYVMLDGINDSIEDADRLVELVQDIPCKINLISFNPHSGSKFKPTCKEKMIRFLNVLAEAGCVVFMRESRGDDQMAACGQLGKPGDAQAPLLKVPARFQTQLCV